MTSQIIVLNKKRSFAISESKLTLDDFKTYVGEEKIFKISDRLSAVAMVSGSGRFGGETLKNHIGKYRAKINMDEIKSVLEIKDTLNDCIQKSTESVTADEYIQNTFPDFERKIKNFSKDNQRDSVIEFLKLNSLNEDIDVLEGNMLLNNQITKLINSVFTIDDKIEANELKFYVRRCYYDYLIKSSPNIVIVGYDEDYENPTLVKYSMLFNNVDTLEICDEYIICNCKSTIVFAIAQDEEIYLNLTGFNEESYHVIKKIVFELFEEFLDNYDDEIKKSIDEKLESKIYEIKLQNIGVIVDYIEFLPDFEIFKLLDILIELTSIKKKFSNEPHSVGGRKIKAILRKYDGIKFIE